ncbi:MAG: hypothetical protein Q8O30_09595 [Candidatus Omnitrophota bacterium]|nr:hypothetical protein [Candidatus Omnitrophota bacterium]
MVKLSEGECIDRLIDIKNKLSHFLHLVEVGNMTFFDNISLELRKLFCKKSGKDGFLVEIKNRFMLKISVYFPIPLIRRLPKGLAESMTHSFENPQIDWFKKSKNNTLFDLWTVLKDTDSVVFEGKRYSYKKFIEIWADKRGAHIDIEIPDVEYRPFSKNILIENLSIGEQVLYSLANNAITMIESIVDCVSNGKESDFARKIKI